MTENARRWLFFLGGAGLALLLAGTVVALKIERGQDAGVMAPLSGGEAASSSDASRPARTPNGHQCLAGRQTRYQRC